jgi:mRNA-degrading endonuclease toxin of MazEF toxin-antitoxin module
MLDPQGRNLKVRPAVVVTSTDAIIPGGRVRVVAVTRRIDQSPPAVTVVLPWDANGHPRTRLREKCGAVGTWTASIPTDQLTDTGRYVSGEHLLAILQIVAIQDGLSAPPPPPAGP